MECKRSFLEGCFIFLCTMVWCVNSAYCAIDECHWSIMGPTAVAFDWRGSDNTIYYGTTSGVLTSSQVGVTPSPVPDALGVPYWECALTGLSTDTLYYYKIGSSGAQHTFRTPPLPGASGFTIAVASDFQESSATQAHTLITFDQIAAANPRFLLHCGDITGADDYPLTGYTGANANAARAHLVYNFMMTKWSQDIGLIPTWGNHDWDDSAATTHDMAWTKGRHAFPNSQSSGSPPLGGGEDWCWFDYGNTRFISYPDWWTGEYTAWASQVDSVFSAAQNDANIKWIVVWGHRPAYSSGYHPRATAGQLESQPTPQLDTLAGKYSKFRLSFYGHNHVMEIAAPAGPNGVIHVGASSPYPCQNYGAVRQSWDVFRALHPGFVKVTFNAQNIVLQYIAGDNDTSHYDYSEIVGTHNPGDVLYTYMIGTPDPPADNNAPTPNPMTWASAPAATSRTSIAMTAAAAADATGPVQYFFQNTTSGMSSHNSGWQTDTSWTDTGLTADTMYSYQVQARDSASPTPNVGGWSETAYETTWSISDLSSNGVVDLIDFAMFADYWLESDCAEPDWCGGADLNQPVDSTVDLGDLEIFVGYWLDGL